MSSSVQKNKDRLIIAILIFHAVLVGSLIVATNHYHSLWEAMAALVLPLLAYWYKPVTLFSRSMLAVGLVVFSTLLIHLANGLDEMQFHIFVILAVLTIYYDWRIIMTAGLFASLHHLLGWLTPNTYNLFPPDADFSVFLLHTGFIWLCCAVLAYQCFMISRSVGAINQSSQLLVKHDLPNLMYYMRRMIDGRLEPTSLLLKARPVQVVAHDELGDLTHLYNQLVNACHAIAQSTEILGQGLRSMLEHSQDNINHIRDLSNRIVQNTEPAWETPPTVEIEDDSTTGIEKQIKNVTAQMALAAIRLDQLQHWLEVRIGEQAKANDQLEHMIDLKGRFFASLTHEMRTPLTAILGYSELLLESRHNPLNELQKKEVAQINQSALNLRRLINDILDLSKLEVGKLVINPEMTNIKEAFTTSCQELQAVANQKALQVTYELPPHLKALADPLRLHQILLNLLSNAIKFTPSHGQIKLTAQPVCYEAETKTWRQSDGTLWPHERFYPALNLPGGSWIAIQVIDSGTGIDQSELPRLFEEFEQIENSTRHGQGGTGLGLAIVKKLTSLMNGQVVVESQRARDDQPGHTTFTVLLPPWQANLTSDSSIPTMTEPNYPVNSNWMVSI